MKKQKKDDKISRLAHAALASSKASKQKRTESLLVVGIGASAGGLEAMTQLLRGLEDKTGMAFILVQHLAPKHESMLSDILSKETKMPVSEVEDHMAILPNQVYVIPPDAEMELKQGRLRLKQRNDANSHFMPIDLFFDSLAQDQGRRAIGVILSGSASDGALGLRAIKAAGGLTFVQDEASAKFSGMPHAATALGDVDIILPPDGIAQKLNEISRHTFLMPVPLAKEAIVIPEDMDTLERIFTLLRKKTGADFTYYKYDTIHRRIMRRMMLHQIEGLKIYFKYLQSHEPEVEALYRDILISVTRFFREPATFEAIEKDIFPRLLEDRKKDDPIRIWVPACSTGEEAYSFGISLLELFTKEKVSFPIQIFGTDMNEESISKARSGIFEGIESQVSPGRLRRFFVQVDGRYRIGQEVRDLCVFAQQDVTKDPPFSNMDLITCQNLLIYLQPVLQKRVLTIFHYALKASGFLVTGGSESIGPSSDLFALVNKKHKLYSKKSIPMRLHQNFPYSLQGNEKEVIEKKELHQGIVSDLDLQKAADRLILGKYAPAGVVVNTAMDIFQFRGHCGPYLEPAPGAASFNLLRMARGELVYPLRDLLKKVQKDNLPSRKEGLRLISNGEESEVNLEVTPLPLVSRERYFLISFEKVDREKPPSQKIDGTSGQKKGKRAPQGEDPRLLQLQHDLAAAKEYLQSIIQEREADHETIQSAHEEILSSNEELQSTNEELETAKEELQSTNEELITVNEELEHRNLELSQLNDDLSNLLNSVQIPIIMVGNDLRIRRFTPRAQEIFNLIPGDVGRPLTDLRAKLPIPNLKNEVLEAIEKLSVKESQVQDEAGRWFSLHIRPYKTLDNKIDGAVLSLIDINTLKEALEKTEEAHIFSEAIFETISEPLLVLDGGLSVKMANRAFYKTFQVSPEETVKQHIYNLGNHQWDIPDLRKLLEDILPKNTVFNDFIVEHTFEKIGHKKMRLNARRIEMKEKKQAMILLAIRDASQNGETGRS